MLAYSDKSWVGFTLDHLRYFSQELAIEGTYLPFRYSLYGGGKFMFYRRLRKQKEESVSLAFNFLAQDKSSTSISEPIIPWNPWPLDSGFAGSLYFPKTRTWGRFLFSSNIN